MLTAAAKPTSTDNLQQKTKTAFVMLTLITQACHGIQNTGFVAPNPKPEWFDDLKAKLDVAKTNAADWINNLSPDITGGVPVKVINYGTTFDAISSQIMEIVNAHPDASGKDNEYVKEIHSLVSALEAQVQDIITKTGKTSDQLKAWGKKMQKSHDALSSGAADIQNAEVDLQADINKMNVAINALNGKIRDENIAIACAAGSIGVGLFLLVGGIALAPETGGYSLIVAGTGGVLILGGIGTWVAMQIMIDNQFDEIAKDQKEKAADKRQLVALKGLASASNQVITYINECTTALSDFRTCWSVFQGELSGVLNKLERAEGSLEVLVSGALASGAQKEWKAATAFAEEIADAEIKVETKELPMSSDQAAA